MICQIKNDGKILALVVKKGFNRQGVNFFSGAEESLQLGVSIYNKGTTIKPHIHKDRRMLIKKIQEVLYINSGQIRINIFSNKGKKIKSCILNSGDTIILFSGGHGFDIIKKTKITEVKQGPYFGVKKDKLYI